MHSIHQGFDKPIFTACLELEKQGSSQSPSRPQYMAGGLHSACEVMDCAGPGWHSSSAAQCQLCSLISITNDDTSFNAIILLERTTTTKDSICIIVYICFWETEIFELENCIFFNRGLQ